MKRFQTHVPFGAISTHKLGFEEPAQCFMNGRDIFHD